MVLESVHLEYREGGSDKVYNVFLEQEGSAFEVKFAYGRRGAGLNTGSKIKTGNESAARKVYNKLISEKIAKGYTENGAGSLTPYSTVTVKKASGFIPQLLNECDEEELEILFESDLWLMQEKFDGERRSLIFENEIITATNKKGQEIGLSGEIGKAFLELTDRASSTTILDGEDMGSYIMLFDKISKLPYKDRYEDLLKTVGTDNPVLRVCKTAFTPAEKRAFYKEIFDRNGEGVVFKKVDSLYSPGRPNSGGPCLKFKFKETATCKVLSCNEGKRSVKIGAFNNGWIAIGNVTVYTNHEMPKVGDFIEVEYLYYYEGGSLFQPVLKGIRTDVNEDDCNISKLKRKPENE